MTSENLHEQGEHFEMAVDAIVSGNAEVLRRLLQQVPDLIRTRSSQDHRAMLLHYVAANGVEQQRQRTPPNAVDIAQILIAAGAAVDATFLDGGSGTTPLVSLVTSVHPHRAGIAADLVATLATAGAALEGLKADGEPLRMALEFGYLASAEALDRAGAKVDTLSKAGGLGRLDLVRRYVNENAQMEERDQAFALACMMGHTEVASFLLDSGAPVDKQGRHGFTGLMWSVRNGHTDTIGMLLGRDASMESVNEYGGTALGVALHFHATVPESGADYAAVIDLLLQAGATCSAQQQPTGDADVDTVLRKHGAIGGLSE